MPVTDHTVHALSIHRQPGAGRGTVLDTVPPLDLACLLALLVTKPIKQISTTTRTVPNANLSPPTIFDQNGRRSCMLLHRTRQQGHQEFAATTKKRLRSLKSYILIGMLPNFVSRSSGLRVVFDVFRLGTCSYEQSCHEGDSLRHSGA